MTYVIIPKYLKQWAISRIIINLGHPFNIALYFRKISANVEKNIFILINYNFQRPVFMTYTSTEVEIGEVLLN